MSLLALPHYTLAHLLHFSFSHKELTILCLICKLVNDIVLDTPLAWRIPAPFNHSLPDLMINLRHKLTPAFCYIISRVMSDSLRNLCAKHKIIPRTVSLTDSGCNLRECIENHKIVYVFESLCLCSINFKKSRLGFSSGQHIVFRIGDTWHHGIVNANGTDEHVIDITARDTKTYVVFIYIKKSAYE
jgi:hypothetical protein